MYSARAAQKMSFYQFQKQLPTQILVFDEMTPLQQATFFLTHAQNGTLRGVLLGKFRAVAANGRFLIATSRRSRGPIQHKVLCGEARKSYKQGPTAWNAKERSRTNEGSRSKQVLDKFPVNEDARRTHYSRSSVTPV